MTTQKFFAKDIKGLTPAIDPIQSEEIFALEARNLVFDSKGPKSVYSNRLLTPLKRSKPEHMQGFVLGFRQDDRCFSIDGDGIWEWNEELGEFQAIYLTPDTTQSPDRWTHCYLAGLVYLCHPTVGLLVYDRDTNQCYPHEVIGVGTPTECVAITVNNGRLCVLTSTLFAWSHPSNGLDFTPEIGGAGFQLLSDRVSGEPIFITSSSAGCLSWTSGGVMRSEFTGGGEVFRHRSLDTEYRPVNSFCVIRVEDETTIILDERGLFQVKQDQITAYDPVFNEFLIQYVQDNDLKMGQNLRLEWDYLARRLYVSVSLTYATPIYEVAFVLYSNLGKWGQFNEPHYGIFPILVKYGEREGDFFAYADSDGCVRIWQLRGGREKTQSESALDGLNLKLPLAQYPAQLLTADECVYLASAGRVHGFSYEDTGRAGYYEIEAVRPATPQAKGLDARLALGFFRPLGNESPDQLSEVLGVLIRNEESALAGALSHQLNYLNHGLILTTTNDGHDIYQSAQPEVVETRRAARYYACSVVGVWHSVTLTAYELDEFIHLKTVELTVTNAGRLL